ncbi:MAG: Clp protease N-terminal domain-containing protein [Polyangiaceae bacterium]
MVQRAAGHVQSSGKEELKPENLLIAIFAERDSYAVQVLNAEGVTSRCGELRLHGVSKIGDDDSSRETTGTDSGSEKEEGGEEGDGAIKDLLARFTVNLNEEAKQGRIDPLIGREAEVTRCIRYPRSPSQNNLLLTGDAGAWKDRHRRRSCVENHGRTAPDALKDAVVYAPRHGKYVDRGHEVPETSKTA